MSDEEMETITHERRTREKQKRRTPDEIWKAHVDQSFKPVDSIKCVKFKERSEMERSEQKANAPERSTLHQEAQITTDCARMQQGTPVCTIV